MSATVFPFPVVPTRPSEEPPSLDEQARAVYAAVLGMRSLVPQLVKNGALAAADADAYFVTLDAALETMWRVAARGPEAA